MRLFLYGVNIESTAHHQLAVAYRHQPLCNKVHKPTKTIENKW